MSPPLLGRATISSKRMQAEWDKEFVFNWAAFNPPPHAPAIPYED
jgi:hypothetical protein